ncbi:MAG TPA: hypothetical protein VGE64_03770 [Xanthomonadaceae bacterium]
MIRTAFATARTSGLLPAVGWTILIVGVIAFATGLWGGYEWRKGRDAIADVKTMKDERDAHRRQIGELHAAATKAAQRDVDNAVAYREATERLDAIASDLEKTNARNRAHAAEQRQALAAVLQRNPDLARVDAGADVLRHWNRSNQGATGGAGAAPAVDQAQPAGGVPGRTAPGGEQPPAQPAGEPRRGGRAVPRVQGRQERPGGSGAGMAAHGVGVVLQFAGRGGPGRQQLQGGA